MFVKTLPILVANNTHSTAITPLFKLRREVNQPSRLRLAICAHCVATPSPSTLFDTSSLWSLNSSTGTRYMNTVAEAKQIKPVVMVRVTRPRSSRARLARGVSILGSISAARVPMKTFSLQDQDHYPNVVETC